MNAPKDVTAGVTTVLIAEDSPTQAVQLSFILEQNGFRVLTATDGRQALAMFAEERPDLIISDIVMPEMDGFELCRRVRESGNFGDTPVILLTSLSNPEDVLEGLACGADNFITKPYDEDRLLLLVNQTLADRTLRRADRKPVKVEVMFGGKRRSITACQQQMLSLLLSTYEAAVQKNTELIDTRDELKSLNERLEYLVEQRTADLSGEVGVRKQAEEQVRHLNRVLRAIRNINQLIVREKDLNRLVQQACDLLTESRGYNGAWIVRYGNDGRPAIVAQAGWGEEFAPFARAVAEGNIPPCDAMARTAPRGLVCLDPEESCSLCPLASRHRPNRTVVAALRHAGGEYGLLGISLPEEIRLNEDETGLVEEVAGDIAFAMYSIGAEQERESLQKQLYQSQKMEAIGILAGGVAHDFNNILTIIQGNTELLILDKDENAPIMDDLTQIREASLRAAGLTRQLLMFSRRQHIELIRTGLNVLVENLLKMMKRLIGENITVETEFAEDLPQVMADPGSIEQMIMNLTVNARDAMPDGGSIVIKTQTVVLDGGTSGAIPFARPGSFVCLTVTDTGTGMDDTTLGHIFEPFYTTKDTGKGTGLGLSVVYGIVRDHGGWINVYSDPGHGTSFRIYVPAAGETDVLPGGETGRDERTAVLPPDSRILLVEDDAGVRRIARKLLEEHAFHVTIATSGEDALRIFGEQDGNFDLVFSDVVLSGIDGLKTVEQMVARKPGLKVALASGYSDMKAQWEKIRDKGFIFIQKPYSREDLINGLRKALENDG